VLIEISTGAGFAWKDQVTTTHHARKISVRLRDAFFMQKHYDLLADAVLYHVEDLLISDGGSFIPWLLSAISCHVRARSLVDAGLERLRLPLDAAEGESTVAIYVSHGTYRQLTSSSTLRLVPRDAFVRSPATQATKKQASCCS
jgi:hypothetical protein